MQHRTRHRICISKFWLTTVNCVYLYAWICEPRMCVIVATVFIDKTQNSISKRLSHLICQIIKLYNIKILRVLIPGGYLIYMFQVHIYNTLILDSRLALCCTVTYHIKISNFPISFSTNCIWNPPFSSIAHHACNISKRCTANLLKSKPN